MHSLTCAQCGRERNVKILFDGISKLCRSCACRNTANPASKRHGMWKSRLYHIWGNMRARCGVTGTSRHQPREHYQDRGITVCPEWAGRFDPFMEWAQANGYAEGLELDRRDNSQGYSPENCRWVTHKENQRNNRRNVMLTAFGRTQCLTAWAEEMGFKVPLLRSRLRLGWPIEGALSIPAGARRGTGAML